MKKYYINAMGLVPCLIQTNFGIYQEGKVAGFEEKAVEPLEKKELVKPLSEEELEEFKEATPAETDDVPLVTFMVDGRKVEIPMNYEKIHHHKLKKIAQSIDPAIGEIKKVESLQLIEKFMQEQAQKAEEANNANSNSSDNEDDESGKEGAE